MPFPTTTAAMRIWIRRHTGPGGHVFLLRRKADHDPIGAIGFGGQGPIAELGYALGRPYWGHGYATEAVFAMIDLARKLGLGGLQAYSFIENPASARVLEKAGFDAVGVIVREYPKRVTASPQTLNDRVDLAARIPILNILSRRPPTQGSCHERNSRRP
jgi:RimJ/RimL family protein N-acetyltransferase